MLLLEIAARGVTGALPASGRAALRPGHNVIAADGAALRRLLEALLYPTAGAADGLAHAAGARAGVTLSGDDGLTYRLVRDFPGPAQLHRYDPVTRAFAPVAREPGAIAERLAAVGVPAPSRLALLAWSGADLPSRHVGALAGNAAARAWMPPPPSRGAPRGPRSAADGAGLRARADALRAERARAAELEALQRELDALQTRLFRSDEALKEGGRVREAADEAEAALGEHARIVAATEALGDVDAQLEAWHRARARRDEAVAKATAERGAIASGGAAPRPLWREAPIWAGVGVAVAAVAAAFLGGRTSPGLRYVALLDVPALGYAAWAALGWIGRLEAAERGARRLGLVDEFERKAVAQHDREAAPMTDALAIAGVASPAELRDRIGKVAELQRSAAAARERLAAWETSPEVRDAREARGALEEEIRRVETRLGVVAGGIVRDAAAIDAELAVVESALATATAAGDPAEAAGDGVPDAEPVLAASTGSLHEPWSAGDAGGPAVASAAASSAGSGASEPPPAERIRAGLAASPAEPIRAVLAAAAAELGGDPGPRLRDLAARAAHVAAALSADRLAIALDGASIRIASGGRQAPERDARPADRDVAFLAARIAILERALAAGGRPGVAILDDPFGGLPDGVRRIAAQLLREAARGGQLLHATNDPAFRAAADHVVP